MILSKSSDDAHLLIGKINGDLYRRENKTESYVVIPPALIITDSDGAAWTLGTEYNVYFEFNVMRNDVDTGEFASKIEYRAGQLRIFNRDGVKSLSRNKHTFI